MVTRHIDKRDDVLLQHIQNIETQLQHDQRVKRLAFWSGVVLGAAGTVGAAVAYDRYQTKKNPQ